MTLYKEWQKLIENQTEKSFEKFWDEYAGAEIKLYTELLENGEKSLSGTLGELAEKFEIKPVFIMAFLDGISESLQKSISVEEMDLESKISLSVNYETLYLNMLKAEAKHLYTIYSWNKILTSEKRDEIEKEFKKSKTYVKEKTPGRNDPCSCGSGKKYKKCCGRDN